MPIGAAPVPLRPMTGAQFRSFQETRPDHERWELVIGIPMMMVPPTIFAPADRGQFDAAVE